MPERNQRNFFTDSADEAKRKKIIEEASYVKDKAVIKCPTPLRVIIRKPDQSKSSLGNLDVFPLEVVQIIFQFSDLETLSHFRRLNRHSRFILGKWPVYSTLLRHIPEVLLTFVRTGAASYFTAERLKEALYASACAMCGQFGSYLYMPECKRCCAHCVEFNVKLFPMPKEWAVAQYGLTEQGMATIPVVSTVPGEYFPEQNIQLDLDSNFRTFSLVSRPLVLAAAAIQHGGETGLQAFLDSPQSVDGGWRNEFYPDNPQYSTSLCGWQNKSYPDFLIHGRHRITPREVAMSFPYLNRCAGTFQLGISCQGCAIHGLDHQLWVNDFLGHTPLRKKRNMEYSEEGFIEHLADCEEGRHIWETRGKSRQDMLARHRDLRWIILIGSDRLSRRFEREFMFWYQTGWEQRRANRES